jgi:hypothetical protein
MVRFSALVPIPKERQGGIVPPPSVLAPESALGSVLTVALSSAQVDVVIVFGPIETRNWEWTASVGTEI